MRRNLRYFVLLIIVAFATNTAVAQTTKWREMHKVKKKETIFGIARQYGITIDELKDANPEMKNPDYTLKKGDFIFIPYSSGDAAATGQPVTPAVTPSDDITKRAIRLGVMLPLHDDNGDGRRMVEYYRGVLMGCDSLRREGISIDVHAWNLAERADVNAILSDPAAAKCDLIIGPLYSAQMDALSRFVDKHNIQLIIPFSINAPQLVANRNIWQIYQSPNAQNDAIVTHFIDQFRNYQPVIIDCNDSTSRKGVFTGSIRRQMEQQGIVYKITNLKSSEQMFQKMFSKDKPNVVVLNTGRLQELNMAFAKLNSLKATNPELSITVFGYSEWLAYTKVHLENFYKFNTFIPSTYFMNPLASATSRFQSAYRANFHQDMMNSQPRFALTGFDHVYYFCKGFHTYGKTFSGARGVLGYSPLQTPLYFERIGNGGLQNRSMMFIHYKPDHRIEVAKF